MCFSYLCIQIHTHAHTPKPKFISYIVTEASLGYMKPFLNTEEERKLFLGTRSLPE